MNSKERVMVAVEHKRPDRVPVGEMGIDHDHVSRILGHHTYWRNRKDTTLAFWDGRRDEVVESMKEDYAELVEKLDFDLIAVELVPPKGFLVEDVPIKTSENIWENRKGEIYRYAASNDSIQCVHRALEKDELTEADIDRAMERALHIDDSVFEVLDYFCDRYGKERAIVFRSVDVYSFLFEPFGGDFQHQLMLTAMAPEEILRMHEACLLYNQALVEHCRKKGVTIMMQPQDFGISTGPMFNMETFRTLFAPLMKKINDDTVAYGMLPFFHCCGNIWKLMDDYVACGYQGYQSIQETATMDNRRVKELYGDRLTLWTGIQCETLVAGTMEETEDEVLKNLDILMPGGGFLFGSTNSVQYGARTDNYLKALEVVREKGIYR
ncbi:MAG TPA: hypothetical protein IAC62_17705 [Candidatus Pelethocola excrementipullorum]|nr:hypothetical protein [Candidatus Pelethocola excrementipullorum]